MIPRNVVSVAMPSDPFKSQSYKQLLSHSSRSLKRGLDNQPKSKIGGALSHRRSIASSGSGHSSCGPLSLAGSTSPVCRKYNKIERLNLIRQIYESKKKQCIQRAKSIDQNKLENSKIFDYQEQTKTTDHMQTNVSTQNIKP